MLRSTLLALALGAAGFLLTLWLVFAPSPASKGRQPAAFDPASILSYGTETRIVDNALHITLNAAGNAIVTLPVAQAATTDYPYIHLALRDFQPDLEITLSWRGTVNGEDYTTSVEMTSRPRSSLWLAAHEIPGWDGRLTLLLLRFSGEPGGTLILEDLSLHPPGFAMMLRALRDDWTNFAPWELGDVNAHTAITRTSPYYPTMLVAILLFFCVGSSALMQLLRRPAARPEWPVFGLLFLVCWLILDVAWQYKLLRQLAETREQFAGKSTAQKLASGPDAQLYNFVSAAQELMRPAGARIFVAADDTYKGMRTAYYFYPYNAYWKKEGPQLPHPEYLRSGDYIAVIDSEETRVMTRRNLVATQGGRIPVDILYSEPGKHLLRVR